MRIVKLKGGVGNQMFQYSFAKLLEHVTGDEVKLDMSTYADRINDLIRQPRIFKMNISLKVASDKDIRKLCLFKHEKEIFSKRYRTGIAAEAILNPNYYFERDRGYRDIQKIKRNKFFDGYWQSWKNVDEIWDSLKNDFAPNYQMDSSTYRMIEQVNSENSVFIGVRKGDYTKRVGHFGFFGQDYFQRAIEKIELSVENPVYYIFSNDIAWVKDNIDFGHREIRYREQENVVDDFEDLMIMAHCKHSIILNSTYHWWGARLFEYPGKVIVAPRNWFFDGKPIDIIPPRWIQIDSVKNHQV